MNLPAHVSAHVCIACPRRAGLEAAARSRASTTGTRTTETTVTTVG